MMKQRRLWKAVVTLLCAAALITASMPAAMAAEEEKTEQLTSSETSSAPTPAPVSAADTSGGASVPESAPDAAQTPTVDQETLAFSSVGQEKTLLVRMHQEQAPKASVADPSIASAKTPVWSAEDGGYHIPVNALADGQTTLTIEAEGTQFSVELTVATAQTPALTANAPADAKTPKASTVNLWMDTTSTYTFQSVGKQYTILVRTTPATVPVLKSSDPAVVSADTPEWSERDNGYLCRIYSEGEGNAVITVTAGDAEKGLPVRVVLPQTSLSSDTSAYKFASAGQQYTALFRTNPDTRPVVVSSDPSVVTAKKPEWNSSVQGYLCTFTAGKEGNATITVTAGNAVCTIPITVEYVKVDITRDTYDYTFRTIGQTYTVRARTSPNYVPVVTTSDSSVVTVGPVWKDQDDNYFCTWTARGEGNAAVFITAGKSTATIPVTVAPAAASVWIDTTLPYSFFYPNQHYTLLARISGNAPVVIYSTDPSVVSTSVKKGDRDGEYLVDVCAKKNGKAQVIVSAGKSQGVMPAEVGFIPISITSDTTSAVIPRLNQTYTALIRTTRNLRPTAVSSNSAVARVEKLWWDDSVKGYLCQVRGLKAGSATITLSAANASTSYTITVKDPTPPAQRAMQQKAQGYSSNTRYLLLIDQTTRHVGIFTGSKGNWSLNQYWSCSVGAPSTPTVTGEFTVQDKGFYFDSGSARCFYWTRFYGGYLFHSTLYYQNNRFQPMDSTLGAAISHGCVRLQINNAKWIQDNVPYGSKVVSYR